jgi:hypothetical protein
MFSHMMVGSNDIARSKIFYDATFAAMGGKPAIQDPKGRLIYIHNGSMFIVTKPIDGNTATHGNGCTRPVSTMAARRLKTRPAFAKAAA